MGSSTSTESLTTQSKTLGSISSRSKRYTPLKLSCSKLGLEDANASGGGSVLGLLDEGAEYVDPMFRNSIAEVIVSKEGHSFKDNKAGDKVQAQYGDSVAKDYAGNMAGGKSHDEGNEASQKARVLYGNNHGGKSVFD
jgi:hypothetical protein